MKMGRSSIFSFLSLPCVVFIQLLQFTSSLPIHQNSTSARCHHDQSDALLHFKRTTMHVDPRTRRPTTCYSVVPKLDTWKEGSDCCSWDGVSCNGISGHVVELDLSCAGLYGFIQSNSSLLQLSDLESLNLDFNDLNEFPISLGNLSKLSYLSMYLNNLTGQIPSITNGFQALSTMILSANSLVGPDPYWVFNISSLQTHDISHNSLVGPLPSNNITWPHKLTHLDLSSNSLTGIIPYALLALPSLVSFSIGYNNLTGYIGEFQSLMLQDIDLSWNLLKGGNFSTISKLVNLKVLDLSLNNLAGTFELDVFSNLKNLERVDLSSNSFLSFNSRNNTAYSPLPKLTNLDMSNCNGNVIPFFIRNLVALEELDLSHNNIQGLLPEWLHNTSISDFILSGNSITGGIQNLPLGCNADLSFNKLRSLPSNLSGLAGIDLSHNFIETGMENLNQITKGKVDLSYNKLGGSIPENISMIELDMSHNFLESGIEHLPWKVAEAIDLSFNKLSGAMPINLSMSSLGRLDLSFNKLYGAIPGNLRVTNNLDLSHNVFETGVENLPWIIVAGADINLSFNKLGGAIPGNMTVSKLDLSHNSLASGMENLSGMDVYDVDLSFNKLGGTIPGNISMSFIDLSHNSLESGVETIPWIDAYDVDLSFNKLIGEVKGNFSMFSLNLSHNYLTGVENIHGVGVNGLRYLDLSFNNLQGNLPIPSVENEILAYLISNNKLSGKIHPDICNWKVLGLLDLSFNNLRGEIPDCMLKIPFLQIVNLRRNNLSGIIPQIIVDTLSVLDMSNNQLRGMIPRSLVNCSDLIYDTFPSWLKGMQSLKVLMLGSNRLYGDLESSSSSSSKSTSFTQLRVIDVAKNNLYGNLPSYYFQSWKSLMEDGGGRYSLQNDNFGPYYGYSLMIVNKGQEMKYTTQLTFIKAVDFSNNKFGGVIPESIGNLISLVVLNLSGNHISGEMPSSLGKMVQLNSLDLSNNMLSGRIPGSLSSLTFLGAFNVSENTLEGQIPQGGQLTTFTDDSFKGNPDLCGIPLSTKCGEKLVPNSPPVFQPVDEHDESLLDGFTWESVVIGYGCGFILGILGGVLILKTYQEFVLGIFNIRLLWRIKRTHRER